MLFNRLALAGLAALATVAASGATAQALQEGIKRDRTIEVIAGDPEMAVAMKQARSTLPDFLALSDAPRPSASGFAVKVGVRADDRHVEYFWIGPFKHANGRFSGTIDNIPELAKSVKLGDIIRFGEDEIVDWLYLDNGRMKGNFTACVLFRHEPREQAEAEITKYGMDCNLDVGGRPKFGD